VRAGRPRTAVTGGLNFAGPALSDSGAFPPDTMGAAGPSQFIVAINGRLRSYAKATGTSDGVLEVTMNTFFSPVMTPPVASNFVSDPHIRYDRLSQRWMIVIIDVPGGASAIENRVLLAVSDGPVMTASTVWSFFFFNEDAGVVHVLYGSAGGLASAGSQFWYQNSAAIADSAEAGDSFGATLAIGDLDGSAQGDLAVGVPGEDFGAVDAGVVHVLYGSAASVVSAGSQLWSQNSGGVADSAEAGDRFGSSLATADVGSGAQDDLAIGVPSEDLGTITDGGVVHVLYGTPTGLASAASQYWTQDTSGITDTIETGDRFGGGLGR
jgi:hypothetical protein